MEYLAQTYFEKYNLLLREITKFNVVMIYGTGNNGKTYISSNLVQDLKNNFNIDCINYDCTNDYVTDLNFLNNIVSTSPTTKIILHTNTLNIPYFLPMVNTLIYFDKAYNKTTDSYL